MPAFDSEQTHHTLNQQTDPSLVRGSSAHGATGLDTPSNTGAPVIPPLPSYVPSTRKRPDPPPTTKQASSISHSVGESNPFQDNDKIDPHNFYKMGSIAGFEQSSIRIEKRSDARGLQNHQQTPNNISASANGPKLPPLASRMNSRYASSPTQTSSPLSASKSNPGPLSTAQRRQTSVRELANKFNETADEIPPVPGTSASRSGSVSSNAGKSRASSRSRNFSEASTKRGKAIEEVNSFKNLRSPRSPTRRPRRELAHEDLISPKSAFYPEVDGPNEASGAPLASQSLTDLGIPPETSPRRPLFGEVFGVDPNRPDLGFGISTVKSRRTSDGEMHSPNAMFSERVASPRGGSPSAWYKSQPQKVEDRSVKELSPESANNRRHARSAHETASKPSHPPTSNMYGTDRIRPSSPSSSTTSKRNSQSRIPISTHRRPSVASDSGNSTPSTRSNSAMERMRSPVRTPQGRTRAPPPKPLQRPRSPVRHSRSNTPSKSPRHLDHMAAVRQEAKSPRLNAYISAPLAKKSPPLRSSRPRLPVSSASTSASRARAVERFSGDNTMSRKEPRTRKPKDLEGMDIDIAARKQAIQRSYTRKVGERERRHEEIERKRASMLLESRNLDKPQVSTVDGSTESKLNAPQHDDEEQSGQEAIPEAAAEPPVEVNPKSERELTINTGELMDRSVLDLSMEDSPTLGTFGRFPRRGEQGGRTSLSEEVEPSSAITAGTSDSVDTFFDDEPQDDSIPSSRRESQDEEGLSRIIHSQNSRSSSPGGFHEEPTFDTNSDGDYRESIKIMLGETPILTQGSFKDEPLRSKTKESTSSEDPEGRWSMTSFTSSNRSREERDTPMERIDEHSPPSKQLKSSTEQSAHLSISTDTASDKTPQPWSPASFVSPKTTRTTMDSETYSTINRVLDHYHDPNLASPQLVQDVQQQLFDTQSPLLARQGGWDLQKMTQLFLQQAKERAAQNNPQAQNDTPPAVPGASKLHINKRTSSLTVPSSVTEKELRDDMDEKIVHQTEHRRQESASSFRSSTHYSELDDGVERPARASLNRPEDWDMSPSLGGYDYQALDSPVASEQKPLPPAKDWVSLQKQLQELPDPSTRKISNARTSHPRLPSIKGLEPIKSVDLEIRVDPPRSTDGPMKLDVPPSPLPLNAEVPSPPQPPALPASKSNITKAQPSSNEYGTVSFYQTPQSNGDQPVPALHSNSSGPPSLSKEPSLDGPRTSADSIDKSASPSGDQKRLIKRCHIIKELVDTEHSFCQDMKVVDDIYKGTSNVIISPEDVKILFGNTDQIVTFSTNFLDALKHGTKSVYVLAKSRRWNRNRVSSNTTYSGATTDDQSSISGPELSDDEKDRKTFIGESFGHHMAEMEKVYSDYLRNHDAANQKLQALQKNEKVQIWLKECQAYARDLTSAWNLDSLLVKPVQRILKYPLLLDQLLEVTPENHPDYTALDVAAREMKGISMRINEMKKRADVMEQMNNKERKRKESDVRIGFAKTFGRRTEKLKQQVGKTETIEDKGYAAVKHKFGEHFFQLQVVMRDTEMYCNDIQVFMAQFCEFAVSMEAHIDVAQTSYPEVESKWRKFRMLTKDMSTTALPDHASFPPLIAEFATLIFVTGRCCPKTRYWSHGPSPCSTSATRGAHEKTRQEINGLRQVQGHQGSWRQT